jgi:hypothetical protein
MHLLGLDARRQTMSARIQTGEAGFIEHRERAHRADAVAVARVGHVEDFGGVALAVGLGGALWLLLALAARQFV